MRDYASHDLEDHEPEDQQQGDGQVPSISIHTEAVRVTSTAMMAMTVVVAAGAIRDVVSGHHTPRSRRRLTTERTPSTPRPVRFSPRASAITARGHAE